MTVKELYDKFDSLIPKSLSCEWDNDGLMCSPDENHYVKRVLCSLDATEQVIDYAIKNSFDLIITHHPLIFSKLSSVTADDYVSEKVIKLIKNGISLFSFHTRADMHNDGVNVRLSKILNMKETERFGPEGEKMGIVGYVEETTLSDFCNTVKSAIGSPCILASGNRRVHRRAILGGDGKDFVNSAKAVGADTYMSGRISYNITLLAPEIGINLVEAGHFYTEKHIAEMFAEYTKTFCPEIYTETVESNTINIY